MAAAEENDGIKRIRHRAADLSMGVGLFAILIVVFRAIYSDVGPLLPGFVLLGLGGAAGIGVYAASEVSMSRWFTLWSGALTVLGVVALVVVSELMN